VNSLISLQKLKLIITKKQKTKNKKQKTKNMKTVISMIALSFFALNVIAGDGKTNSTEHPKKYCAKMKGGELVVMHEGKELKSDVTLADGTKIKTNGTVTKKDGTVISLKVGECVDMDGTVKDEKEKPMKKTESKK